jgi:thiol-disulfide isomerase/thioredoxin
MAGPEFHVPHRFKIGFVWASIIVTVALLAYQYDKRASYWGRHVTNAMQPMAISPTPVLTGELEHLFRVDQPGPDTRAVLYHFWATWCAPCRAEIPTLNAMQKRFERELRVVTISADENKDDVLRFFANSQPQFQVLWDKSQKVSDAWGVQKFPESFLVTSDGRAFRFTGPRDWASPEAIDYLGGLLRL